MTTEPIVEELTPHVKTAEAAVATITDPRLREIAFGRILDHLLKSQNSTNIPPKASARKSTSAKSIRSASNGVRAWVRELVTDGFFSEPRSLKHILEELSSRSHHLRMTDLTAPLQKLCHDRILRRRKQASVDGGKEVFHWSNW